MDSMLVHSLVEKGTVCLFNVMFIVIFIVCMVNKCCWKQKIQWKTMKKNCMKRIVFMTK